MFVRTRRPLLFLILCPVLLSFAPARSAEPAPIEIGMVVPLTGSDQRVGETQVNAAKLAVKEINAAGGVGGRKLRLVFQDNLSSSPGSVSAFQKLISGHKLAAVIGPLKTPQALAMEPVIQRSNIPTFLGGTNPRVSEQGETWIFRVRAIDSLAAKAMVSYVKDELHFSRIAILHDTDAFGTGGANLVEKYGKEAGLKIVKRESFRDGDKFFTRHFESFKDAQAQIMVVYSNNLPAIVELQKQLRQVKYPFAYIGNSSNLQLTGPLNVSATAEGIYGCTEAVPDESQTTIKFMLKYLEEYKVEPLISLSWTYDAVHVLAAAMKSAGDEDHEALRTALLETRDFPGVLGKISFDERGIGLHKVDIVKVQNNRIQLLKVFEEEN